MAVIAICLEFISIQCVPLVDCVPLEEVRHSVTEMFAGVIIEPGNAMPSQGEQISHIDSECRLKVNRHPLLKRYADRQVKPLERHS